MSMLINGIQTLAPKIDCRLSDYLSFHTTCAISRRLIHIFSECFSAVAAQLDADGKFQTPEALYRVNCIVTNSDTVSLRLDFDEKAIIAHLIIYSVSRWSNLTENQTRMIIVEELCHHYWNIVSEYDVNFKVLEVLRHITPTLKMEDIYNLDTMRRIASDEGKPFKTE